MSTTGQYGRTPGPFDTSVVQGIPFRGLLDIMDVAADVCGRRQGRPLNGCLGAWGVHAAAQKMAGRGIGDRAAVGVETGVLEGLVHVLDRCLVCLTRGAVGGECGWTTAGTAWRRRGAGAGVGRALAAAAVVVVDEWQVPVVLSERGLVRSRCRDGGVSQPILGMLHNYLWEVGEGTNRLSGIPGYIETRAPCLYQRCTMGQFQVEQKRNSKKKSDELHF
jgi:hypothetical protein